MRSCVTVMDPERRRTFERVLGTATVPVRQLAPIPKWARLPGIGRQLVYDLDVAALSDEQRRRLIAYGCVRFGLTTEEAEAELRGQGFPILADSCIFGWEE